MAQKWKTVLAVIQPTGQEVRQEQRIAALLARKLQKTTHGKVTVAGSVAKGTFLKGEADLDIFVLFPLSVSRKTFEQRIRGIVKKAFPRARHEIKYAEHPYVRLFWEGKRIDVVPAYKITTAAQLLSAVDRSVLHTRFIQNNLRQRQIPEVLLLKKFLKANELYGAEIRVQGFSGYLCELLVLKYKTFLGCLRAAKKFQAPLMVIDPVDKNRNVAAAVSEEKLKQFIRLAGRFVGKPSDRFFVGPPSFSQKLEHMKKKRGRVYSVTLPHTPAVEDIVWGQLRKLAQQLQTFLEKHDFEVVEELLDSDAKTATIVFRVKMDMLPAKRWVEGPPLSLKKNVQAFRQAHKNAKFKIKKGRVHAEVKRELRTTEQTLKQFFQKTDLPSRLQKRGMHIRS